jgi:hypothetical protein
VGLGWLDRVLPARCRRIQQIGILIIQTDQRSPSVSSQTRRLQVNADGSIDVYFGPKAPPGKESNWVQTVPGRGWNIVLRMYVALEPWFNTWSVQSRL